MERGRGRGRDQLFRGRGQGQVFWPRGQGLNEDLINIPGVIPLPSRLMGVGSAVSFPSGVWDGAPAEKGNLGHIKRCRTPVVEGKSGISCEIYNGLH